MFLRMNEPYAGIAMLYALARTVRWIYISIARILVRVQYEKSPPDTTMMMDV